MDSAQRDNILVVDDEAKIREVVAAYLEAGGYRVFAAKNGAEALSVLGSARVSLILLDLMLPDMGGEEICRRVRAVSTVPIIMLTARVDEQSIINGLNIGADDYVTKPFSPRQLMARVAAALRRSQHSPEPRRTLCSGDLTLNLEGRSAFLADKPVPLTKHEFDILALLMSRPNKIFTRDEIIDSVKTGDFAAFDRVIDAQIKNIRRKLREGGQTGDYILTVYGIGYRFGGEVQ
ncbi:MAG: response regulator transcription factor [Spirochaetaceae bacterium]|jgi:DNA-binding response OmpR family regulator|nr:response regulator transcription factor [Spirochaetaceae bacterium]